MQRFEPIKMIFWISSAKCLNMISDLKIKSQFKET